MLYHAGWRASLFSRAVHRQGMTLNIIINEELRSFIDPLTPVEYAALERSLLAEGCRDALVLWRDVLIDGHNRYDICRKHGIEFRTVQNDRFESLEDVMLWVIDNNLARRSVSDFQRGMLALRKKEIVAQRAAQRAAEAPPDQPAPEEAEDDAANPPWSTREDVAKAARVSANTLSQIERIRKTAAPELVEAVRKGDISVSAAATVASLPAQAQVAAVAGGRKELQQAARQVREQKAGAKPKKDAMPEAPEEQVKVLRGQVGELKDRVATLMNENEVLKQKLAALGG
jgi:transcriptional regulator with XRE-family HTH domain